MITLYWHGLELTDLWPRGFCSHIRISYVPHIYGHKFSFPTTYIVVSLLIRSDVITCFLHVLMVWADYRCRPAWMHKSRRCLNYRQGFLIRRSLYWANQTVREDHHCALSIQRLQKPAELPSFDGYSRREGQGYRLHQQAGELRCWRDCQDRNRPWFIWRSIDDLSPRDGYQCSRRAHWFLG